MANQELMDREDMIRLDSALIKEKWRRDIYAKWMTEIFKRKSGGECPRCGVRRWIRRGSGLRLTWMCDDCGLVVSKKDLYRGNIYFDFVKVKAKEEIRRIERMERQSQSVRNFTKDGA